MSLGKHLVKAQTMMQEHLEWLWLLVFPALTLQNPPA